MDTTKEHVPVASLIGRISRARFLRTVFSAAALTAIAACAQPPAPTATTAPKPAEPAKPAEAPKPVEPAKPVAAAPAPTAAPAPATAAAPAAAAPVAPAKSNVTINFLDVLISDDATKKADEIVANFTKATGITVKVDKTPYPQFADKVPTLLSSGSPPDAYWADTVKYPEYAGKNWLTPLDDLIAGGKTLKKAEILDSAWQKVTAGGKIYGIPKDWSARGGYYNKEMLAKAKIDKVPETVAQLKAAVLQVKASDPQSFGYMWPMKTPDTWMFEGLAYIMLANDGQIVSDDGKKAMFNSEANEETMSFFVDIWKAKAAPDQGMSATNQDLYPLFGSGKVAMMHTGFFVIKAVLPQMEVKDKYDTFVVKGRNGSYGTPFSVSAFSIPAQAKFKSEAYELIQWVIKPENVPSFTANPSARAADSPENKSRFDDPKYKPFFLAAEKGGKWWIPPNPGVSDQMRIVHEACQAILLGQKTIKQGLADANALIEKTLV